MKSHLDVSHHFANYTNSSSPISPSSDGFRPRFEGIGQWLNQTVRAIAHALMGSTEPFIWQTSDPSGTSWWVIDDPLTGSRFYALSEEEVRVWVEKHYYFEPTSSKGNSNSVNLHIERW